MSPLNDSIDGTQASMEEIINCIKSDIRFGCVNFPSQKWSISPTRTPARDATWFQFIECLDRRIKMTENLTWKEARWENAYYQQ